MAVIGSLSKNVIRSVIGDDAESLMLPITVIRGNTLRNVVRSMITNMIRYKSL